MPCHVKKHGNRWTTVDDATGAVKGTSDTRGKTQASCNARNAASHGWKPTRRARPRSG